MTPGLELRDLARSGRLAEVAAAAGEPERIALSGAAYEVVWPIVFSRITRRMELNRGHAACAAGVGRLADACLDRFHDDVEAVVEDVLAHARRPILNLEGWITRRLNAATVDGYRRRRGQRGALQRPRVPGWLAAGLGQDRWLIVLATRILEWVGVSGTAGTELWPLDGWTQDRAATTGDWAGSDLSVVSREVEQVLAVMRQRPQWYESYVERPLGRKQTPVAVLPLQDGSGPSSKGPAAKGPVVKGPTARPLELGDPDGALEAELTGLAAEAVAAIRRRLSAGEQTREVVADVLRTVFDGVTAAPSGPARLDRVVDAVRDIIGERDGCPPVPPAGP